MANFIPHMKFSDTMKQQLSANQHSSSPATRARATRTRDNPKLEPPNGVSLSPGSKPRLKHSLPEGNNDTRSRRAILTSKLKLAGDSVEPPKEREMEESRIVARQGGIRTVEHYPRLRQSLDADCKGAEQETDGNLKDGLQRGLDASESLVADLQSEVSSLKSRLEKLQSLNVVLESRNNQLTKDLSAAEEKIKNLERSNQVESNRKEIQPPEFKNVRELIANKLDLFRGKKEGIKENKPTKMQSVAAEPGANSTVMQSKISSTPPAPPSRPASLAGPPPPPPPPPPPRCLPSRTSAVQNANPLVNFYHSLNGKKETPGSTGNSLSQGVNINAHNSIVDELQNRSAHLLAIKADVEKRGGFVNLLIQKVQAAAFDDIEDVLNFVDWLDGQLSVLADERAVLRHFNWPERKADALREAAFEYRDLKHLLIEVSSFQDDVSVPCDAFLKKIAALLDKCEQRIQRLIKLRDTTKIYYRDCKIPADWMLDTGMISKIKMASVKLAKVYMKRVSTELESTRHLEREMVQEALLYQGVHFAYRVYQFAGGLDLEAMRAFERLKERAQLHRRGSRQLIHSVALT